MSSKYQHLLSPVKVGGVVLKNRMIYANSLPHFLQANEKWPSDALIRHYGNVAKNGAAIVTVATRHKRRVLLEDGKHMAEFDMTDKSCHNYISLLAETIHFYGSKAAIAYMVPTDPEYDVVDIPELKRQPTDDNPIGGKVYFDGEPIDYRGPKKEAPLWKIKEIADSVVEHAKLYHDLGFDMIALHMSYEVTIFAHFLSPKYNKRTDMYGGSLENRCRFLFEICDRIKQECGKNFLIEVQMSGEEEGHGLTLEELCQFAHMAKGRVDIIQLRAPDGETSHPLGFNSIEHEPFTLKYSEALKNSGSPVLVSPIGGFQDPDDMEKYIAEGKADLIHMGRAFFCDPEFGKKLYSGRGEDIVPCIRCNKCHGTSKTHGPWMSVCSVNPTLTFGHRITWMTEPPESVKRVAVIGGGPAGMNAAITAAKRGHKVTLYEKSDYLGGQLYHAEHCSFKWPVRNFRNYLVRQLEKSGVTVLMNTKATPEMIRCGGFDAVLLALGAVGNVPDIKGIDTARFWLPLEVYGREHELGKNIVVVGGAEIGTETGMYLADTGHTVTVLTRQKMIAQDADRVHYRNIMKGKWESYSQFSFATHATTVEVTSNSVTYIDKDGAEHTIPCDDIVIAGGMTPLHDEALSFSGCADTVYLVGDCSSIGNIQKSIASSYSIASMI